MADGGRLKLSEQENQGSVAPNETQMLDSPIIAQYAEGSDALVGQLQVDSRQLKTGTEFEFNKLKSEIEKWFELAEATIHFKGKISWSKVEKLYIS